MYTWPETRPATTLLQSYIINVARFLGITKYCPIDVVSQTNSSKVVWQILGPLLGMVAAYGGGRAKLLKGEVLAEKEMGTAHWRADLAIEEEELLRIADLQDPKRMMLACKKLVIRRLLNLSNLIDTRLEWLVWKAFDNDLQNFDEDGVKFSLDYGLPAATVPGDYWDDKAESNPIFDLQNELRQFRGTGVQSVDIVYNGDVELLLSQNEFVADRVHGTNWIGSTGTGDVMNLLKKLVQGESDGGGGVRVRDMVKHDEVYRDKNGDQKSFLPSDTIFLIGEFGPEYAEEGVTNDRGTPAVFASTPALQDDFDATVQSGAPDAGIRPGKFVSIVDQTKVSPKKVVIEGGINGLVVIKRPQAIRRIRVKARV